MNLVRRPELIDRLASAYALGTLRGGARRRFESLARQHPSVRAAAMVWQTRISGLTELEPGLQPDAAVWTRIRNQIDIETQQAALLRQRASPSSAPAERAAWWAGLGFWRGATGAASLALAVLAWVTVGVQRQAGEDVAQLQAEMAVLASNQSRIEYVAVLSGAASQTGGAEVLVTFDTSRQRLTLQRVGTYQEAPDKSLQLWALPPGGKPRSLGVLGTDRLLQLAARAEAVKEIPALAISLEPKGGVSDESGPTGPVLFSGRLIRSLHL